nr:hydroxyproline O-arabinosyltransferase 3-like [Coffea arabica]
MGRATPVLLVLLSLGFFFVTYNLITTIVHYRAVGSGKQTVSTRETPSLIDPVIQMPLYARKAKKERLLFHVALTATDAPYSKWQCRIMYYWYKKKKDLPGSEMGKFTRILHSGSPDNLIDEIPTFVVDPLPKGLDQGYVVLNRPWAFVQWLEKATIDEEYILMAEPDHIFLNPLSNLAHHEFPAAFPFFYIKPTENEHIIRKFFPEESGPVSNVDPIGNSPVIIKKDLLEKISPTWMNVSLRMKNDAETDKTFGWVLEMYAYAVASALHGVQHILWKDFMLQPPWDLETRKKFILHYTYGCDYNMKGELTYGKIGEWRFDKRSHLAGPPPKNISLPPPGVPESVVTLVKMVNEATANLPNWETT